MANLKTDGDHNVDSSRDPGSGCDEDVTRTRTHDEENFNSKISNSPETVVNKNHAVGRDAGSQHDEDASKDETHVGAADQGRTIEDCKESTQSQGKNVSLLDNSNENLTSEANDSTSNLQSMFSANSNLSGERASDECNEAIQTKNSMDFSSKEEEIDLPNDQVSEIDMTMKETEIDHHEASDSESNSYQGPKTEESHENEDKEKFNVESLNYELQVGYRILNNMMSASNRCVNKMFLFPVDDAFPETSAYYEKIKRPMWMFKMKEKFESHQYEDITEFMADFRLMIENCYRFNGPDNFVSKRAQKLETMMKQKVALLSKVLRDKILGAAGTNNDDDLLTSAGLRRRIRNPNMATDDPSQQLLSQLRKDRELQEKVDRRQKVEDRKAMEQARLQELQAWEDNLMGPDIKEHIRTMWELPQIGLFVYLCMESLGLEEEVTQYQIERGLALPRECSDFRRLMTCLLSTPHQRKNLKSFMPYHVWNEKLMEKLDIFYKVLSDKNGNDTQACYKLGFDLRAFKVMGKVNPMRKKKFHELTFLKRVWILKNLCDYCLETQQYLQKTIEDVEAVRPNDVREVLLGSDGRGYRYLNFPMFTGKDIRIFKHQKLPEPTLESLCMEDWSVDTEKPSASSSRCSTPIHQRNSRQAETPLNSLRARALLQAAESKEASPFRDSSRAGSESMDASISSSHHPSSENLDGAQAVNSIKSSNPKKRKKTSIFTGKKKRLKIKKTMDSSLGPTASTNEAKAEEDSLIDNGSLNNSVSAEIASDVIATESTGTKTHNFVNGHTPTTCDNVQTKEENDTSDLSGQTDTTVTTKPSAEPDCVSVKDAKTKGESEVTSTGEKQQVTNGRTSPALDSSESSSQQVLQDKQLDSAYLSCESDKSGRDEEELKASEDCEPTDKINPSTLQQHSATESHQHHLDHCKEESMEVQKVEIKKELQDEDGLCSEAVKMGADEVKLEEPCEEKPALCEAKNQVFSDFNLKLDKPKTLDDGEEVCEEIATENQHKIKSKDKEGTIQSLSDSVKKEELQSQPLKLENGGSSDKSAGAPPMSPSNSVSSEEKPGNHRAMDTSDWDGMLKEEVTVKTIEGGQAAEDEASLKGSNTTKEEKDKAGNGNDEKADEGNGKQNGEEAETNEDHEEVEEESDEDEDDLPERGRIELVAESMEDLRLLMHKLSNPDPIKRGKKVYPGVIKPCEEELLANLTRFHDDLLKFEKSLVNARAGMQVKLRKEVDSYTEPKLEESKGWDSDHSRSTKDSSEDEEEEAEEAPDSKSETETGRKSKRIKAKQQVAATTSLLTSAASKLSAISDNNGNNEDSNDSFELDISSRGRLRKRRVIPNNTEDTGLRKRKFLDSVTGTASPATAGDTMPSAVEVSSAASTLASIASLPTVIQRQPGKPWPSHILSMLTSGGLSASSSAMRAQLVTTKAGSSPGLQQHLLAGQVFRLVSPSSDGSVKALHVSGGLAGGRGIHPAPGSVIISPQNLASIRFVSSTGVVTLPRERILSAGSSSISTTSTSSAQASHPVIQQLLLNKSARGQASPSKVSFVPTVTVNGSIASQTSQPVGVSTSNTSKMSVIVTLPSSSSALPLHLATASRSTVIRPPVEMATSQRTGSRLTGVASATPVVVNQVSSTMSGGKQVLDLGSLSVTQIQQLMRNQAIQINMGGAGSGPTTLLLTTGLQQLGSNIGGSIAKETPSAAVGNKSTVENSVGLPGVRVQQQQQILKPGGAATGASSLLAMINNKGQKLVTLAATSGASTDTLAASLRPGQVVSSQHAVATGASVVSPASTNSALKSVLNNRSSLPQSVLAGRILSSPLPSRVAVPGSSSISQSTRSAAIPMPRIISSLSPSAPVATSTLATTSLPSSVKGAAVASGVGKDPQQKARTIITVPLVHLSSPSKKYASNVTVKALLENRAPKKSDGEEEAKNTLLSPGVLLSSSTNNAVVVNPQESSVLPDLQSKQSDNPQKESMPTATPQSATPAVLTSLNMPLSVNTGSSSGLECTTSEVIVPTVHIKVPSPNTLPSVLHNKNGTTIVQSTKVPIAVASEAKAPETASPSASSFLVSGQSSAASLTMPQPVKVTNVLPVSSASLSTGMVVQASPVSVSLAGASIQQNQQQGVKNVMLKVTPQSGGSGQYVQGYMTSRGLVIPQSALVQQNQNKNVILANVAQNGSIAGSSSQQPQQPSLNLPVQQTGLNVLGPSNAAVLGRQQAPNQNQSLQQLQVLGATQTSSSALALPNQLQKGTVINSGGVKFMLVNPLGQVAGGQQATSVSTNLIAHQALTAAQQAQTSTPAAELVKQIAANSIQVQSSSQAALLSPQTNTGLSPRAVQKSGIVVRAQPAMVRMSAPSVGGSGNPRTTGSVAVQQIGVGSGEIITTQNVISSNISPSNISPQLAAQILALQQQQQQQQQQHGIVLAGGKPVTVGQQLQQPTRPGAPSVVTLQLQQLGQLGQLFSNLTQLQPGGVQQQQQPPAGQQPGQIVQLSLNPNQTLVGGGNTPQTQQLIKVASGQVSPQIQLPTGQLQAGQGAGLVLQQPQAQLTSQNVLLQQKAPNQPAVGSTSINLHQQAGSLQPLLSQQAGSIIKLPQPAASASVKPHLPGTASSSSQPVLQVLQHPGGTIASNNNTPSTLVSLSPSQGFIVSPAASAPLTGNQQPQQLQFVLNPSSLPSLPVAGGVSPMPTLSKLPGGNIRRVIRADSSLLQTSLGTSTTSLTQTGNISSPAVVIGGTSQATNSAQLAGGKQALTQMILPTSVGGSGQFLISPLKLEASPQANIISPLKLLGGLQVASTASASSQGTQILMNSNQLPGTILGKPSVIYAGQSNPVQANVDKSDTKMAQVLLGQPNGNLLQVQAAQINKDMNSSVSAAGNSQQLLIKSAGQILQTPVGGPVSQLPPNGGLSNVNVAVPKTTFLYKVGDQYFSPAGSVAASGSQLGSATSSLQSIPFGTTLLPSSLPSSKPDVQLLVPPACIEASEKMLLQSKNVSAPSSNKSQNIPSSSSQTIFGATAAASNSAAAVNGTHFSFSLSGPTSAGKSQTARSGSNTSHVANGQVAHQGSEPSQGIVAAPVLAREESVSKKHKLQQSSIPTSGGDAASASVGPQQQVVSGTTGDEEEAAMNLLTLANQAL